jgi:hypothetical protein
MWSATAAGTRPASDSPDASRRRTSVDETASVGASTKKIPGLDGGGQGVSIMRSAIAGSACLTDLAGQSGRETTAK